MIISHKHKFIFLRTRKTAGSSLQTYLAKYKGDTDIITGPYTEESDSSHSEGFNSEKYSNIFNPYNPHTTLQEAKSIVTPEEWNSYFKFALVRNPYEIAVSRYCWDTKGKSHKETSIDGFREWVSTGKLFGGDTFSQYISEQGVISLDFIAHYENLNEDIKFICDKLCLPYQLLPTLKSGYRDKIHFSDYYTPEIKDIVYNHFKDDIDMFDYKFDNTNIISKRTPIIDRSSFEFQNDNINNPTVISVPSFINNSIGKFYCYFSNHSGTSIKMAYTDDLNGKWTVIDTVFTLRDSACDSHIASPEIVVENNEILMYYHGDKNGEQKTFLAKSSDGINFTRVSDNPLCDFYLRVFKYKNKKYGIAKSGNISSVIYDVDNGYVPKFSLLPKSRHCAVYVDGDMLYILYSKVGDAPEHIRICNVKLDDDISNWEIIDDKKLVSSNFKFEGAHLEPIPSMFGSATLRYGGTDINELRDPFLFRHEDRLYIYYVILGEKKITWAEVINLK